MAKDAESSKNRLSIVKMKGRVYTLHRIKGVEK
jgi:hypothetical protein